MIIVSKNRFTLKLVRLKFGLLTCSDLFLTPAVCSQGHSVTFFLKGPSQAF
jgi:hypothetical protein